MMIQQQQEYQMEYDTYQHFMQLRQGQMSELFPLMKLSEMEDRILQEWQSLSQTQKNQLMENLQGNGPTSGIKREPTPLKSGLKEGKRMMQQSTKSKVQPNQNVGIETKKEYKNMPKKNLFHHEDQMMPETQTMSKGEMYISFYKFCYERLRTQHTKWTPVQVAAMVRLIWKKRKAMKKQRELMKKTTAHKLIKKTMTGKVAFKHAKLLEGFTSSEIIGLWKRLPVESRKMWGQTGRGDTNMNESKLHPVSSVMKNEANQKMNFMFKQM